MGFDSQKYCQCIAKSDSDSPGNILVYNIIQNQLRKKKAILDTANVQFGFDVNVSCSFIWLILSH